jgi:hypothetical protein
LMNWKKRGLSKSKICRYLGMGEKKKFAR